MYGDQRWTYVDFWGHTFTDSRRSRRLVSYSERKEFVEKSVEFLFAQLQPSVDAFRRGLNAVFDGCEGGYLEGRDLMEMVVGVGDVDVEELRKATQYEGYEFDDQAIMWFWEILKEMKTSQRIAFLQFATARSRLPTFSYQAKLTVGASLFRQCSSK